MTSVNLAPAFESSQLWDMTIATYEATSSEYRKEVEEKIFSLFRTGSVKPLYDYDALRTINKPLDPLDPDKSNNKSVFNLESLEKMKKINSKFFKD